MHRRTLLTQSVCLLFGITVVRTVLAAEGDVQHDVKLVQTKLRKLFSRLVALSKAAPPPGLNAANGWFIEWVRGTDVELGRILRPTSSLKTNEGRYLDSQVTLFGEGIRRGFAPGLHSASGLTYLPLGIEAITAVKDSLRAKVKEGKLSSWKIDEALDELGAELQRKGVVTAGTHANGWVSVGLRDNCNAFNAQLSSSSLQNENAAELAQTMRDVCKAWAALPTDGHDPWLKGSWQLGFEAIAAEGIRTTDCPSCLLPEWD